MIKFNAGYFPSRQAHFLVFGLTNENLNRLWLGQPIHIQGSELELPAPGAQFIIFAGKDQTQILDRGQQYCEAVQGHDGGEVACIHVHGKLYVVPLPLKGGKTVYLIGLDAVSYKALRENDILTFRCRMIHAEIPSPETAELGINVEVGIFWGPDEQALHESLRQFISPKTGGNHEI